MIYKDYLYTDVEIKRKQADALIRQRRLTKQVSIKAMTTKPGLSGLTTQGGGRGIASEGVRSGRVDAKEEWVVVQDKLNLQVQQDTGRTDGGWGWKEGGSVMSEKEMKKLSETPLYKGFKKMYSVDSSMAKDNLPTYSKKYKVFEELYW